jgi:glucosamine-6-phosphate deaminase
MKIEIFENYDALSKAAANVLIEAVKKNPTITLGLATGSTPIKMYQNMIKDYHKNQTSYAQIKVFNLDEYFGISKHHPASYHQYMVHHLFNYINIDLNYCEIPNGKAEAIDEECIRYNTLLNHHPIDIQILGIGANGHIGFNEPGTPFDSITHKVTLDEQTRADNARFFNDITEVPTEAITMGIKNIMRAKKIILLASGLSKADAVYNMVYGKITKDMPASILNLHPNVTVFLDYEAASKIRRQPDEILHHFVSTNL